VDTISWRNRLNSNSLEDDGEITFLMKEKNADHNCNLMVLDRCEAFWFRLYRIGAKRSADLDPIDLYQWPREGLYIPARYRN
jgi:hypothetical protein